MVETTTSQFIYLVIILFIFECNVSNCKNITCNYNNECIINCDSENPVNGCYGDIIDGLNATSLTVSCSSSLSLYEGGCQFSKIYCPNSQCNILCNDYYGCYLSTIYASQSNKY